MHFLLIVRDYLPEENGEVAGRAGPHHLGQHLLEQRRDELLHVALDHVDRQARDRGHEAVKLRGQPDYLNLGIMKPVSWNQ